ncbi:hypothetical protein LX36DRAFT_663004 [Colletotrichum falcatum]|nr:hypothetical protein LX36DRAFT_663004 [Colletotrichum falcatum]
MAAKSTVASRRPSPGGGGQPTSPRHTDVTETEPPRQPPPEKNQAINPFDRAVNRRLPWLPWLPWSPPPAAVALVSARVRACRRPLAS